MPSSTAGPMPFAAHFGQNRGAVADGKSETVKAEVKAVTGK